MLNYIGIGGPMERPACLPPVAVLLLAGPTTTFVLRLPIFVTRAPVSGGHIYRGEYFSDVIAGAYVFADYQNMYVSDNQNM